MSFVVGLSLSLPLSLPLLLSLSLSSPLTLTRKERYGDEADDRWLRTFCEDLTRIQREKRGFVVQIQKGVVRETSNMQIAEEEMGTDHRNSRRQQLRLVFDALLPLLSGPQGPGSNGRTVGRRMVRAHRGRPAGPVALHGLAIVIEGDVYVGDYQDGRKHGWGPTGARTAGSSGSTRFKREREGSVGEAEAGEQRKGRRRSGCQPFRETCAWAVFVCLCYFSVMNMSSWKIPSISTAQVVAV